MSIGTPETPIKDAPGRIDTSSLDTGIALVTVQSAARLNAFSAEMRRQLIATLRGYDETDDVRAIVVTGAGQRAFSAGQDLTEAQTMDGPEAERWVDEWCSLYEAVLNLNTPTVAAMNGYAVGAGLQTALVCDVRVASLTAQAGMPEVDDAIPCITGTWSMEGLVADGRIADLVQTGRMLTAQEMLDWGLVTYLAPPGQLIDRAGEIARRLASCSQRVFRLNKAFLRRNRLDRLGAAAAAGKAAHREAFASGEPAIAMRNFLTGSGRGLPA
jgi:enoyl-CoA hydratase/carnithine racemase